MKRERLDTSVTLFRLTDLFKKAAKYNLPP
jgi:hypothetical protein